jgi:parallel beta-helix repeat protein
MGTVTQSFRGLSFLSHYTHLVTKINSGIGSEKMGLMTDGSSKAKLPGVSLDNAAYTRIENNCIEGNWGDGVKFVRSVYGSTVARNIIANNNQGENDEFHFFGVLIGVAQRQHPEQSDFPSCYNQIVENDILGPHHAGVHLLANTTGNQVQNNRIIDPVFAAVEDHTITGNLIQNNGADILPVL